MVGARCDILARAEGASEACLGGDERDTYIRSRCVLYGHVHEKVRCQDRTVVSYES